MLIKQHEPFGDPNHKEHPLPENWQKIAEQDGLMPVRFAAVDEGKLYRSGIVCPRQIPALQDRYGINHIISLMDGDWLEDYYKTPRVTIHQFPFHQRKELTAERAKNIVDTINELDSPVLVHCLKGVTRTGMVSAAYQILNGQKSNLGAFLEYLWRSKWHVSGLANKPTIKEIFNYGNHKS